MAENVNNTPSEWMEEEEFDIDWAGYALKLKLHWKFIAFATALFAVVGVGVALLQKHTYTVTVLLAPESKNGGSSSLGGLASMFGLGNVNVGGGSDALNINLFPEISQSTLFLTQLFDVQVTPYVSPKDLKKGAMPAQPLSLYDYFTKGNQKKGLVGSLKESVFGEAEVDEEEPATFTIAQLGGKQRAVVNALKGIVKAEVEKSGMVNIGVTMEDPWIATTLADTVCNRLQQYVIAYRTQKTQEDLNYYQKLADEAEDKMVKAQAAYAQSVDFDRSVILQSVSSAKERLQREAQLSADIYSQMAQQVEMAKAKLQESKPVYAVVEPAIMPAVPDQSRKKVVLVFMLAGFVLSAGWKLVGEDFLSDFKQQLNDRLLNEKQERAENNKEQSFEA